jgi:F420H(2)-dependent biliverdin reductase
VSLSPADLPPDLAAFLAERHVATLTTARPDGSPHVVPVEFTWDAAARLARVITSGGSRKARNAAAGGRAARCQVDGRRWVTLEGQVRVATDPAAVAEAVACYRSPRTNPQRVVVEIAVDRVIGGPGAASGAVPGRGPGRGYRYLNPSRNRRNRPPCGVRAGAAGGAVRRWVATGWS